MNPTDRADAIDDPSRIASTAAPDPERPPRRGWRLAGVTAAWWAHALVRVALALALLAYGLPKLVLMQFGTADLGDALIAQGEMSPMGLLWRMVAFSPLFQFLGGLAEVGAALALLWRRTVALGAVLALADMALVFVLNMGYDVPVKQLSLALAIMAVIVMIPWIPRLVRALAGHGPIPAAPRPRLLPWRLAERIGSIAAPIVIALAAVAITIGTIQLFPGPGDDSLPTGVWTVAQDTAPPAAQLAEDTRWQAVAFGQNDYHGVARVQIRQADGVLLEGVYERTDATHVRLEVRPLRAPGQSPTEYRDSPKRTIALALDPQPDGTLHVQGDGIDLVLAPDPDGRLLFDRGLRWSPRPDDPFNR